MPENVLAAFELLATRYPGMVRIVDEREIVIDGLKMRAWAYQAQALPQSYSGDSQYWLMSDGTGFATSSTDPTLEASYRQAVAEQNAISF
jgi:hypothetical protein